MNDYDLVVLGPGPGQPDDGEDERIHTLNLLSARLLDEKVPFLGVCLGHQVTCHRLGFWLVKSF